MMIAKMMKCVICLLFVLALSYKLLPVTGFAMNTGFTVDEMSEDEISTIFERLELRHVDEPDVKTGFSCFDVNENGEYALGFDAEPKDMILVYSAEGAYLYGFSFDNNGSFGFEWDDENIIVYVVRSDLAVLIDKDGKCLDMKRIQNTSQNNTYWNHQVWANTREVNDNTFTSELWSLKGIVLPWTSYPYLVKTMPDGERVILFDNTAKMISTVIPIIIISGIVLSILILTVRYQLKHKSTYQSGKE